MNTKLHERMYRACCNLKRQKDETILAWNERKLGLWRKFRQVTGLEVFGLLKTNTP